MNLADSLMPPKQQLDASRWLLSPNLFDSGWHKTKLVISAGRGKSLGAVRIGGVLLIGHLPAAAR